MVGYPLFQIDREQPLKFSDRNRVLFESKDLYTQTTPAFHVAKYSVKDILPQLATDETLDLSFSLTGNRPVHLKVPPEAIAKWQESNKTKSRSDRNLPPHNPLLSLSED